jgi:hypothetical protein
LNLSHIKERFTIAYTTNIPKTAMLAIVEIFPEEIATVTIADTIATIIAIHGVFLEL